MGQTDSDNLTACWKIDRGEQNLASKCVLFIKSKDTKMKASELLQAICNILVK